MSIVRSEWWIASLGSALVWARLDLLEAGTACVFDCDGRSLPYDSEDSARNALLDAEFRAWDGLDEVDAAELGIDLASLRPPQGEDPESLRARMIVQLPRRQ
jgi:hypothetical protein